MKPRSASLSAIAATPAILIVLCPLKGTVLSPGILGLNQQAGQVESIGRVQAAGTWREFPDHLTRCESRNRQAKTDISPVHAQRFVNADRKSPRLNSSH